jgi:mRNA interferase RelE/StbE
MYRIEYAKQVKKSIEKFPKKDKTAILDKIESLATIPRPIGVDSMKGNFSGYYRIRIGAYRVIYSIQDKRY